MSRDGHIDLALEDATHRFRLAIGDLEALQEATGRGPPPCCTASMPDGSTGSGTCATCCASA